MVQSYKQRAYRHIQEQVLAGDLVPGDHLSYRAVARDLGISPTPVREAIGQLVSEGLLVSAPGAGNRVRRFTRREIEQLYDFRELLEGPAVEMAATRLSDEQLAQLRRLCDKTHAMCHEIRDRGLTRMEGEFARRWIATDARFHMTIIDAAGNSILSQAVRAHRVLSLLCTMGLRIEPAHFMRSQVRTWREHMRILRALEARDPALAKQRTIATNRQAKATALHAFDRDQMDTDRAHTEQSVAELEHVFGQAK